MARNDNFLLKGISGQLGKEIVVKLYGKKSVITKYPDMSNIKPSKLQCKGRSKFAEVVVYAQNIIRNPELKAMYRAKLPKKAKSIYHYAIKEYMRNN